MNFLKRMLLLLLRMSRGSLFWELRLEPIWRSLRKEEFSNGMEFLVCLIVEGLHEYTIRLACGLVFGNSSMNICIPRGNEWDRL